MQKGKSMFAVCYCGFDRAACGACGRGYQQEVSAGRSPKFIECPDGSTMTVNKLTNVVSVFKKNVIGVINIFKLKPLRCWLIHFGACKHSTKPGNLRLMTDYYFIKRTFLAGTSCILNLHRLLSSMSMSCCYLMTILRSGKPRAAIVGHKDTEYKSKKIPVCKCGTSTPECKKCGEGYVERTLRGEPPLFMEKQVRIKQVAVCACGEPRKTCDVCHLGWVETCQKGNMPTFKDVEVDDEEETSETANKEAQPGGARSSQIFINRKRNMTSFEINANSNGDLLS